PTKEPSCCAMALPETCADRVPRPPYRACANTAEPIEAHTQRAKDHRAAPNLHGPANCQPAGAIRARRRDTTCDTRTDECAQAKPAHAAVDAGECWRKQGLITAGEDCLTPRGRGHRGVAAGRRATQVRGFGPGEGLGRKA